MAWKSIQVHVRGSSQLVNPSRGLEHHRPSRKAHKGANCNIHTPLEDIPVSQLVLAEGMVGQGTRRQIHFQNPAHVIRALQGTWWEASLKGLPKATFLSSLVLLAQSPFRVILFGYFVMFVCMVRAVSPWFKNFLEAGFRCFLEGRNFCPSSSGGVERSCLSSAYFLQEKESIPKHEFFFRLGVVGENATSGSSFGVSLSTFTYLT